MENKIYINIGDNMEIVAEVYSYDGVHDEVSVYIQKDGLVHQDICLVRPSEEKCNIECLVWADDEDEDYTHKFEIEIYEEE